MSLTLFLLLLTYAFIVIFVVSLVCMFRDEMIAGNIRHVTAGGNAP